MSFLKTSSETTSYVAFPRPESRGTQSCEYRLEREQVISNATRQTVRSLILPELPVRRRKYVSEYVAQRVPRRD